MSDLISIGLPFHNDRPHLARAIRSVLQQTWANWELLLLNDGSRDGSLEVARAFTDPRIRLIDHRENRGLACRLNEISEAAKGEYLFRMDADDVMHPCRLERQWNVLDRAPANTVLGTAAIEMDEGGGLTRIIRSRGARRGGYSARRAFIHSTIASRTAWFRENRYSEAPAFRRTQDAELWIRTAASSRFELLDEPLLFYRRPGPASFDKYLWQALALVTILANSSQAGAAPFRLLHCVLELIKLQIRFASHVLRPRRPAPAGQAHENPELVEYRRILDKVEAG